MNLIRDLDSLSEAFQRGAVAIGNFDGVHLGHAKIVHRLLALARSLPGPAIVFTFDPQPAAILRPEAVPPPLTWTDRKAELLTQLGVDLVVAYPTDRTFLQLTARRFFDHFIRQRLNTRALVEGPNFFFGHDRAGNIQTLGEFCKEAGITLEVVPPVQVDGQTVSSSRIRKLVAQGHLSEARRMLNRPHRIRGEVVHGAGRGATLGYPTANLRNIRTLLPGEGIYAGLAWVDGQSWSAAISVGPNPTFNEGGLKVEAHLLGYAGSLYGRWIDVDFLHRLRDILRFATVEELLAQMDRDVAQVREIGKEEFGIRHSEFGEGNG